MTYKNMSLLYCNYWCWTMFHLTKDLYMYYQIYSQLVPKAKLTLALTLRPDPNSNPCAKTNPISNLSLRGVELAKGVQYVQCGKWSFS